MIASGCSETGARDERAEVAAGAEDRIDSPAPRVGEAGVEAEVADAGAGALGRDHALGVGDVVIEDLQLALQRGGELVGGQVDVGIQRGRVLGHVEVDVERRP